MADNYEIDVTIDEIFGTGISSVEQTVESHEPNGVNEVTVTLTNGQTSVFNVRNGDSSGKPTPVSLVSEMTNPAEIYLYTGSEEGYVKGDIYCYKDNAWTDVGAYGGMLVDDELDADSENAVTNKAITEAINATPQLRIVENGKWVVAVPDHDNSSASVYVPTAVSMGHPDLLQTDAKSSLVDAVNEVKADTNALIAAVGSPMVASTVSAMTDHTKIYVYTGAESSYTYGHWYYWNGVYWEDGGVYQSDGLNTDKTLTVANQAADGKAVGDEISDLKSALDEITVGGVDAVVEQWLDDHPEATTTVQDGAITDAKLSSSLKAVTNVVDFNGGIENTILSADSFRNYIGGVYTINQTINLSDSTKYFNKVISNCTFILNTTMFTWTEQWMPLPDFVNCVFIGNGNYIVDEGLYCSKSKFINCIFSDCGIINNGDELQSARFLHCRFRGTTDLIKANILNDFDMESCQFESDFNAKIVDTSSYDKGGYSSVQVFRVLDTVIEGQSASASPLFTIAQGSQISFDRCYFEQVRCGLLDVVKPSNAPTNPMLMLSVTNCKYSVGRSPFINVNSYFENGDRVYIDISNNQLTDVVTNPFISTVNFKHIEVVNNIIGNSYITLQNTDSLSDVAESVSEVAERLNVKVIDFWADGTLSASTDTTINSYSPQIGEVFDKFAYADRLKYTNVIGVAVIEKGNDASDGSPINGVYVRPRLYGNSGYANYVEIINVSSNSVVSTGKYRVRIAYTD